MISAKLFVVLALSVLGCGLVSAQNFEGYDSDFRAIFAKNAPVVDPETMLDSLQSIVARTKEPSGQETEQEETRREITNMYSELYVEQADKDGLNCDFEVLDYIQESIDEENFPNLANYLKYFRQKRSEKCHNAE